MRALITGAGNAGRRLAERLCAEGHEVVLVDQNSRKLEEASAKLDLLTICGNAASPAILAEAKLEKAALFAAVTDNDEVNILSALFAYDAGVRHTVVRVSNSAYLTDESVALLQKLGIDLVVNEHDECAREIQMILNMPGSREVVEMVRGMLLCVGLTVREGRFLTGGPLRMFAKEDLMQRVRLIAVMRQGNMLIPDGDLLLQAQDTVYIVGAATDVRAFMQEMCTDYPLAQKVIIAGGGDTGLRLAQRLEHTDRQIVLIEKDEATAQACSARLGRTMVIHGNALDKQILEEIGADRNTAIVATMGDDENNILAALLAKKTGASYGLAIVSTPSYVEIINDDNLLDRAVSPYLTTINAILRFIRGTNIRAVNLLHDVPGELLQIDLPVGSRWDGVSISRVKLLKQAVVAALLRGEEAIVPTGDTVLHADDRLVIFVPVGGSAKVEAVFQS